MYKCVVLCLCVSLSGVLCYLNKAEGAECEWEGLKGKCVKRTRCMTTLDEDNPKHPVCSRKDGKSIICCTDCQLVNNTENAVFSPTSGLYWKDGRKARDSCLQYLEKLPYQCKQDRVKILRVLDVDNKCYQWHVESEPAEDRNASANKYPHLVMLGYGDDLVSVAWLNGGTIISNKYILTTARANNLAYKSGDLKFVALGVQKLSDSLTAWQIHKMKRFIPHPDYDKASSVYNDIALIETETPITFNKNVLPACLHVEDADAETAITTTWRDLKSNSSAQRADKIQTINLDKFSEEECKTAYYPQRLLKEGIDYSSQMCYGSKSHAPEACKSTAGEPLLITTQLSRCIYTIIGVMSFGQSSCGRNTSTPDVYTRVAHYKPWIESIVWA